MATISNQVNDWHVVVVDDQVDNIAIASTVLQFYGAKVSGASNGADGIDLAKHVSPTFILLDLTMPGLTGWDVFKILRSNADTAHIPVIALTAHAMEDFRVKVLEAGFDGYMSKPFEVSRFIHTIRETLGLTVENAEV